LDGAILGLCMHGYPERPDVPPETPPATRPLIFMECGGLAAAFSA
jgi:hypothetical protein